MAVPRVALVGPTATGKSAVALAVAERRHDVELVSIDSMQVYRRMDIGTAKPTPAELRTIRHHLVDLVDPWEEFTVADFQRAYRQALTEIARRGNTALLIGGTGLYHRAVIDDLDLPGRWPAVRRRLEREAADRGPEELHRRLLALDATAAHRIEPTNSRRIVRALEVIEGSGREFSSFGPGLESYPASEVVQIGLRRDRSDLADRVQRRVREMVAGGLVAEVRAILADGGFSRSAGQAIGYKEIVAHLQGDLGLDEAIEQVVVRTRQFAVRQLRWFQRDPRVTWIDLATDSTDAGVAAVAEACALAVTAG